MGFGQCKENGLVSLRSDNVEPGCVLLDNAIHHCHIGKGELRLTPMSKRKTAAHTAPATAKKKAALACGRASVASPASRWAVSRYVPSSPVNKATLTAAQ